MEIEERDLGGADIPEDKASVEWFLLLQLLELALAFIDIYLIRLRH